MGCIEIMNINQEEIILLEERINELIEYKNYLIQDVDDVSNHPYILNKLDEINKRLHYVSEGMYNHLMSLKKMQKNTLIIY
jgi:hypothetical protein